MRCAVWIVVLLAGCGNTSRPGEQAVALESVPATAAASESTSAESTPSLTYPTVSTLPEPDWPALPAALAADVSRCVRDYRTMAQQGLPARTQAQSFRDWYTGPFQTWTLEYNRARERCDPISSALPSTSPAAQALLAAQSNMHARLGLAGEEHADEPQMFVMSRYWTLGAACTYALCADGEDPAWARFCRTEAASLPPCPPVEPTPAGSR